MNSVSDKSIVCDKNESWRVLLACNELKKKKSNENRRVKDVSSKFENNHLSLALKGEQIKPVLKAFMKR